MGGPILVYDGDCAFCSAWVARLARRFERFPHAVPWQSSDLDAFGLTRADVARYAWVLSGSRRYAGHAAFAAILRMQETFAWRFLGLLLVTPPLSFLARIGYRLLARFRHRLPGGTPTCAMPTSPDRPA